MNPSKIIVSSNIDEELLYYKALNPKENRVVFYTEDSLLVDKSREIIKEAYLTSDVPKFMVIAFEKSTQEALNALLKILEEPPSNVVFVLIVPSKSILLPTILSRLPLYYSTQAKNDYVSTFDYKKLDLEYIYSTIKQNKLTKENIKDEIEYMLLSMFELGVVLSQKELELFSDAISMSYLNIDPKSIYLNLLLNLYKKRHELTKNN